MKIVINNWPTKQANLHESRLLAVMVRVVPGIPWAKVDDLLWLSSILES